MMRHFSLGITVLVLATMNGRATDTVPSVSSSDVQGLFAQSAARILKEQFANDDVSYLLLDAESARVVASNWKDSAVPIPLGSLLKPFTALAYGEQHGFQFPRHMCRGSAGGCWLPRGHGAVDLTSAIAQSCNSYFRVLTADMTSRDVSVVASRYRLEPPAGGTSGPALAGLGDRWQIAPLSAARAYLELVQRQDEPGVGQIVEGLKQSARSGTGELASRSLAHTDALAKTGTAICTHPHYAPGDGFAIVLAPSDKPRFLLMVRVHGAPGAEAARIAGLMLHRVAE